MCVGTPFALLRNAPLAPTHSAKGVFFLRPSLSKVLLFVVSGTLWLLTAAVSVQAAEATVIGTINDNFQIISGQQVYEIADTQQGNDLAENHISDTVKVTGTLEERDGMKIITVISVQILNPYKTSE
jgi:hypothetical protein